MAVTSVTTTMAGAINYTVVTDTSADWPSVANSTYFYDKADKLVHYKDSTGTVQELFSSGGNITVGTTPSTGTDGRVFFQAGGVVQQDANFTFDNTLKRLTLKAAGIAGTDIPFAVQNSAGSANLMQVAGDNTMTFLSLGNIGFSSSNAGGNIKIKRNFSSQTMIELGGGDNAFVSVTPINLSSYIALGSSANGASINWDGTNFRFQIKNSFHNLFDVVGDPNSATATFRVGTIASNTNFFNVHGRNAGGTGLTTNPIFTINSSGTVGIGTEASTPGARLDVRAADGLSNPAFRVRNSVDTADIFKIRGNTNVIFGGTGADYLSIIGGASWGTDCYFDFSGGNYIRFLGQSGDISIVTNSNLRSRGTYIGGATQLVYFDNGGNIRIGQGHSNMNQPDVNATRTIQQMTGVAPTTSVADGFQQYSADVVANNAAPHFRTENGAIVKVYQETTGVGASTLVTGLGTPLTDTDTFDGYTLKQIVKALRNQGLLA